MAAILMSTTESVQVSALLEERLVQQLKNSSPEEYEKLLRKQQQQQQQQQQQLGVGICRRLLLVAILFSIEMVASFTQIYSVPILQYLDVPVSLVSVNGIIAGTCSVLLLPLVGYFTDRGSNPKARKICTVFISMSAFIFGLSLLCSCGVLKVLKFNKDLPDLLTSLTTLDPAVDPSNNSTGYGMITIPSSVVLTHVDSTISNRSIETGVVDSITSTPTTSTAVALTTASVDNGLDLGALPFTVFMAIFGFALLDIGFDTATSLTRAFVLETAPSFQHTNILVLATVLQSSAGTTFSVLGCFDLPGLLSPAFHTDGTAAMIVFLTVLLAISILVCTAMTMLSAYFVEKNAKRSKYDSNVDEATPLLVEEPEDEVKKSKAKNQQSKSKSGITDAVTKVAEDTGSSLRSENGKKTQRKFPNIYSRLKRGDKAQRNKSALENETKPFVADILHTEEGDTSTKPLMLEDSLNMLQCPAVPSVSVVPQTTHGALIETPPIQRVHRQDSALSEKSEALEFQPNQALENDFGESNNITSTNKPGGFINAIKQSFSLSTSVVHPPLGEFYTRKISQLNQSQRAREEEKIRRRNSIFKKQLTFLSISTFFTYGALVGFAIYSSNALTLGIYKGDPTAPVGSKGRDLYEQGLQTSAMGSVVLYAVNFVFSLATNRIIQLLGEKLHFLSVMGIYSVACLLLVLTERVEMYFVYMAVSGVTRSVTFSTPYILAQKFTQERMQCRDPKLHPSASQGTEPEPSAQFGKVMALIGFLLPLHYAGMSLFLGPLMEVTGNFFAPTLYGMASGIFAFLFFLPLYFIKNEE